MANSCNRQRNVLRKVEAYCDYSFYRPTIAAIVLYPTIFFVHCNLDHIVQGVVRSNCSALKLKLRSTPGVAIPLVNAARLRGKVCQILA